MAEKYEHATWSVAEYFTFCPKCSTIYKSHSAEEKIIICPCGCKIVVEGKYTGMEDLFP